MYYIREFNKKKILIKYQTNIKEFFIMIGEINIKSFQKSEFYVKIQSKTLETLIDLYEFVVYVLDDF